MIKKKCSVCNKSRLMDKFYFNKNSLDKKSSWCKLCYRKKNTEYREIKKIRMKENPELYRYQYPNRIAYYKSNPKQWKKYYKKYLAERFKNPLVKLRATIANYVSYSIKTNKLVRVTSCSDCQATGKMGAHLPDAKLKIALSQLEKSGKVNYDYVLANIKWLCSECIIKIKKPR